MIMRLLLFFLDDSILLSLCIGVTTDIRYEKRRDG